MSTIIATESKLSNVRDFPTDKALASQIIEDFRQLEEGISNPQQEGVISKFTLNTGKAHLGRNKTYSVLDAEGKPLEGGIHFDVERKVGGGIGVGLVETANIAGRNRFVLKDKDSNPIILCRQENFTLNRSYVIGVKAPLFPKDKSIEEIEGQSFYPMYKVLDITDSNLDYRSIQIWNGHNFQPFLRLVAANPFYQGRNHAIRNKNNLKLVDPQKPESPIALLSKTNEGWECHAAPGVDVGTMISLAAIVNDMVGWLE